MVLIHAWRIPGAATPHPEEAIEAPVPKICDPYLGPIGLI